VSAPSPTSGFSPLHRIRPRPPAASLRLLRLPPFNSFFQCAVKSAAASYRFFSIKTPSHYCHQNRSAPMAIDGHFYPGRRPSPPPRPIKPT
jgi:hypothetical protein